MFRQGLRTSTGPTDLTVGAVADGQVLKRVGSTIVGAAASSGDVVGPASATDNAAVRFDGTTGKLVQNSAVTIADTSGNITCGTVNGVTMSTVVVGPGSATDNAIVRYDGTTGKLVQNSAATVADTSGNITAGTYNGVTVEGHQARHGPGGADDVFANIEPKCAVTLNAAGNALQSMVSQVLLIPTQASSSTSLADITTFGFTAPLPSGVTAVFRVVGAYRTAATTTAIKFAVNYSGTSGSVRVNLNVTTDNTGTVGFFQTFTINTAIGSTVGPGAADVPFELYGSVDTTSTGNLVFRFASEVGASAVTLVEGCVAYIFQLR